MAAQFLVAGDLFGREFADRGGLFAHDEGWRVCGAARWDTARCRQRANFIHRRGPVLWRRRYDRIRGDRDAGIVSTGTNREPLCRVFHGSPVHGPWPAHRGAHCAGHAVPRELRSGHECLLHGQRAGAADTDIARARSRRCRSAARRHLRWFRRPTQDGSAFAAG